MKVEVSTVECERNIEGEHRQMGIKSPRVIVDFMVNKLYTHKIKAITQEISCNARDAHREAGCADRPIEITVPNAMTPFFSVKDYGIGMNYERLTNIYQFIGESSKRETNEQTGGFGIGAKCPWAYSDVFTTETVAWENSKKLKRTLVLHRTPENDISFDIISCEETNEPTGTIVKVPVKEGDYGSFLTETLRATSMWNPKPIIKGAKEGEDFEWKKFDVYLAGTNWTIYKNYGDSSDFVMNFDGVPYPIDDARFTDNDSRILRNMVNYSDKCFVVNANVGEINVALNREALEYSEKTITHIKKNIDDCLKSLKEFAINDIMCKQSLLEAMKTFHEHHSVLGQFIPDVLEWVSPTGEKITINPATYIHIKGTVYSYYMNWKGRLKRSRNRTIDLNRPLLTCKDAITNNTDYEPARSQILGMMDALGHNNDEKTVQVITSYDSTDENTVNILKQNNLTTIESYPRRKNKPRTTGGGVSTPVNIALCWQIQKYTLEPMPSNDYTWSDFTGKAYVLKDTATQFNLTNKHDNSLDRYYSVSLATHLGFDEIYAIREKDEQQAIKNGMVRLYDVLVKKHSAISEKVLSSEDYEFLDSHKMKTFLPVFNPKMFTEELFKNDKHILHKFVTLFKEASEIKKNMSSSRYDYSNYLLSSDKIRLNKKNKKKTTLTFGLNVLYKRITRQYPMLKVNPKLFSTNSYHYHMNAVKDTMCHAIQYVKLIDKVGKSA